MLCPNCQKECNPDERFCAFCGAELSAPVEEVPAEQPAVETPAEEIPVEQPVAETFVKTKKPCKKGMKIAAFVAAGLVVICGLGFVFKDSVMGLMPAKMHYQYVYSKVANEINDGIDKVYDTIESDKKAVDASVGVKLDSTLSALLGEYSKFGDLSFDVDYDAKDSKAKEEIAIKVSGEQLAKVSIGIDAKEKVMYLDSPEFLTKPIKVDISEQFDEQQLMLLEASLEGKSELLIERKVLKNAFTNTATAAFKQIEDVERSSDEIEINGVEQKATLLEAEIDEKVVADMVVEVLEVLKDDKDIEDYVEKIADEFNVDDIDYVDMIEDAIDNFDKDDLGEFKLVHKTWVNSKCEILAIAIEMEGQELFIGTAQDGKDFAAEVSFAGTQLVSFEGTKDGDLLSGDLTLTNNATILFAGSDMDLGKISFDSFDLAALEDGLFVGKIEIAPGADLLEQIPSELSSYGVSLTNPKLVFEGNDKKDNYDTKMYIEVNGTKLATVSFKASVSKSNDVDLDYKDAVDADEVDQTIINTDKVQEVLAKYGLTDMLF